MTLKEAVLKSLEDINYITNYLAVYNHIDDKKYYDFRLAKIANDTEIENYCREKHIQTRTIINRPLEIIKTCILCKF